MDQREFDHHPRQASHSLRNQSLTGVENHSHPMKPHRIRMTHSLVMNYGLYKKMEIFVS